MKDLISKNKIIFMTTKERCVIYLSSILNNLSWDDDKGSKTIAKIILEQLNAYQGNCPYEKTLELIGLLERVNLESNLLQSTNLKKILKNKNIFNLPPFSYKRSKDLTEIDIEKIAILPKNSRRLTHILLYIHHYLISTLATPSTQDKSVASDIISEEVKALSQDNNHLDEACVDMPRCGWINFRKMVVNNSDNVDVYVGNKIDELCADLKDSELYARFIRDWGGQAMQMSLLSHAMNDFGYYPPIDGENRRQEIKSLETVPRLNWSIEENEPTLRIKLFIIDVLFDVDNSIRKFDMDPKTNILYEVPLYADDNSDSMRSSQNKLEKESNNSDSGDLGDSVITLETGIGNGPPQVTKVPIITVDALVKLRINDDGHVVPVFLEFCNRSHCQNVKYEKALSVLGSDPTRKMTTKKSPSGPVR